MTVPAQDDVAEIRARVSLEDLVREHGVQLLPPGGKSLKGLCPFHQEKTPSFYVDVPKQLYHCHGCKAGGDLFRFVEKVDRVTFPEALEILARRVGITLSRRGGPAGSGGASKAALFDALAAAEEFYHGILLRDPRALAARQYLEKRGIAPEMWSTFRLGYSLPVWDAMTRHLVQRGISVATLEKVNLVRTREGGDGHYDFFHGRVMFPILDAQRRAVGFGARTLGDDEPKYINTSKTDLFDKGAVLYGLPQAAQEIGRVGCVAIMEGYTDVIMSHQMGLKHAVATLGTAFTLENARRLRRLANRVDLIFDGDAAGQRAAERSLEMLLAEELDVRIFTVTGGKDPCDVLLAHGGEAFRKRIDAESVDIFEYKWSRTMAEAEANGSGPQAVARALDEFIALVSKLPNPIAQTLQARRIAERMGLPSEAIEARLRLQQKASSKVLSPASQGARGAWRGRHVEGGRNLTAAADRAPGGSISTSIQSDSAFARQTAQVDAMLGVLVECLLAEPDQAPARWSQLPRGGDEGGETTWLSRALAGVESDCSPVRNGQRGGTSAGSNPGTARSAAAGTGAALEGGNPHGGLQLLLRAVEAQLALGSLDGERLRDSVSDAAARTELFAILQRLSERVASGRIDWSDLWSRCVKDFDRRELESRSLELKRALEAARSRGDHGEADRLQGERFALLKRLKGVTVVAQEPRVAGRSFVGRL